MDDCDDIVKEFLVESYENLDRLDRELITLEKNPSDREILASVFRTIHTIKGTSGFLALDQLGAVTHVGESLLGRLANSPLFGMRYIETVRSAVMALGLERVRTLLLGLCMNRLIPKDKWVMSSEAFWRHSLGCALVTQRMAKKIAYPEPEKAYLAGLLHDLGFLVNSVLYTEDFRECLRRAVEQHIPLHVIEEQYLGFTHCETGQLLSEHWGLSKEFVEVARCHHDLSLLPAAGPLTCLVHLSDLLCRVRYLGYGYDEILGVDLGGDVAWQTLVATYPALKHFDLVRFTLDIDGAMEQIVATVDSVFGVSSIAVPATR